MRPKDAYGAAPEEFKASIASALRQLEEEQDMKRHSYRLVICIALLILLATGVVYAATRDWKLFDFYKRYYDIEITEEAQSAITQNAMGQHFEAGDLIFTLQEAVADGRYLYMTLKAEPREGISAYVLGVGTLLTDWIAVDGNVPKENRRSYKSAALEDGKRLMSAEAWASVTGYEDNGGFSDSIMLADGSLRIILGQELTLDPAEAEIQLELTAYALEWLPEEGGEEFTRTDIQEGSLSFTLPVTAPLEQVTLEMGGELLPGTAAQIERCSFLVTPLSCYYEIEYTVIETEDRLLTAHSRNVLFLELVDEQGEVLPLGLSLSGGRDTEDNVHFTQFGSFRPAALPKTLILRPDDSWGAGPNDRLVLTTDKGGN